MAIRYYEHNIPSLLTQKRKLSQYLKELIYRHLPIKKISLSYIFCDDGYLLGINQDFLDHDTYTDIITFDLSETSDELVGEIYISIERVRENAGRFEAPYLRELHRVIFHGVLHLCGYRDKTPKDQAAMRKAEDNCLLEYLGK